MCNPTFQSQFLLYCSYRFSGKIQGNLPNVMNLKTKFPEQLLD